MTIPVELAGVSGILSVSGISRKWCGMPKPLTLKDSPGRGRWHESARRGQGVCGADGEGKDAAKEPDTQRYAPCLSEPSYHNAAGVISPGLPSQALARQLPQSGSPWQGGFVSDETKWSGCEIIENVTARQSLPGQGRWHRAKRRCRRGSNRTRNSLNNNQHRKLTGGGLYHLATCSAADSRLPDQRGGGAVPPHGGRLLRLRAVG